jgi:hypothetical protein
MTVHRPDFLFVIPAEAETHRYGTSLFERTASMGPDFRRDDGFGLVLFRA